jgi:hypothetical protein
MPSRTVSFARTADTNAYTANDVIGSATGSTAAMRFSGLTAGGGVHRIISSALRVDSTAVISGEANYRVHLHAGPPPSALGDNVAFDIPAGDRASYLGFVDLGTPVDLGSTLYIKSEQAVDFDLPANTDLHGYLVTIGAYTSTSARVYAVTLRAVRVDSN